MKNMVEKHDTEWQTQAQMNIRKDLNNVDLIK